jgi:nitrous oxide reductase accessory protein NosL
MISRTMAMSAMLTLAACTSDRPAPIAYDADTCTYCHMQISDRRFAAVIVTRHGRTLKFDSIECLRAFHDHNRADIASIWVSDFAHPGAMLLANQAQYFDLGAGRAPMGKAHAWVAVAASNRTSLAGIDTTKPRTWTELQ